MFGIVPFRRKSEATDVFRGVDELMHRMWHEFPFGELETDLGVEWTPKVDVSETEKELTVKAELPGIERDHIDISLDENTLVIKGEKNQEKEETGEHYHRVERSYGSFYRSIRLPAAVEKDKIDASYHDGILKVVMPKSKEAKERITHVEVH